MTHLAISMFGDPDMSNYGMWLFLSVGAVALFVVFIPVVTWLDYRRKEREAYYKAETIRRLAEAPGDTAKTALELLREEDRLQRRKTIEGLKVGGLITLGVGVGLIIFLRSLMGGGQGSPYLCGLIPAMVGVGMLVYAFFVAAPADGPR
jgi:uncharacterized protein DUF6249